MDKIKPFEPSDIQQTPSEIHIQEVCLKQILFTMKISGCYSSKGNNQQQDHKQWLRSVFSFTYRGLIFCLMLFVFGKGLYNFTSIDAQAMPGNAIVTAWVGSILCTFILCQKANSRRFGHQEEAFEMFNRELIPTMRSMGMTFNHRSFKRKQLAACIFSTSVVVIVIVVNTLQLTGIYKSYNYALQPYPFTANWGTYFIQSVCFMYCSMVATFPLFYAMVISVLLSENFKSFTKLLQRKIHDNTCQIPDMIQDLRHIHVRLCEVTATFDKDLKYLLGNTIFFNIAIAMFILYSVLKDEQGSLETNLGYLNWFVMLLLSLLLMSLCAAMVNEEVRNKTEVTFKLFLLQKFS